MTMELLFVALSILSVGAFPPNMNETVRPIVGILTMDMNYNWMEDFPDKNEVVAASYVKIVEAGGAQAVPIFCNQTDEYYDKMFASTNGLLIPGGWVDLRDSGYAFSGRAMLKRAVESGIYYPIWGTCLGFEFLLYATLENGFELDSCKSSNILLPLKFNRSAMNESHMGYNMPVEIEHILSKRNVTANFHSKCVTVESFESKGLHQYWLPLASSFDEEGVEFISLIEAKRFPFWASQFHPEKNIFEWNRRFIGEEFHSPHAIKASQYFANFFVDECRKNNHSFANVSDEEEHLFYNFSPVFTGDTQYNYSFTQVYFF